MPTVMKVASVLRIRRRTMEMEMEKEMAEGMRIRERTVRVPKRSCISRLSTHFGVSDTNPYWAAND
jgi:hypothetical protein